ncbi:hypothetical protein RIF29_33005 [Crotalaria pallida]|uniref:DUF4228 domain-containing protein n=1 Tax=Crotalaria pallida TaxID=3830 RepID=A0AAN9E8G0_CROPI
MLLLVTNYYGACLVHKCHFVLSSTVLQGPVYGTEKWFSILTGMFQAPPFKLHHLLKPHPDQALAMELITFNLEAGKGREMGNCQTADAASLVIQHPSGKIERLYWSVTASEVMNTNPGHYVSLIIPLSVPEKEEEQDQEQKNKTLRYTSVKLLRPNETLTLGHAYRLITTQEVVKIMREKKRKPHAETIDDVMMHRVVHVEEPSSASETGRELDDTSKTYQARRAERHKQRAAPANPASLRPKSWQPSLRSITESPS